jgi:undecaprenyl-diphosphatase
MSHALQAAFLGIVQGLTEFLPVSSTAHLLISEKLIGFDDPNGVFAVMIQLGSILAVVWLYRDKILEVVTGLPSKAEARAFALAVIVAVIPALVAGGLLSDFVKSVLYSSFRAIAVAFIVGGLVMLMVERLRPKAAVFHMDRVTISRALAIGIFQTLALIPGVSRSGATIVGGLVMGLDRPAAAEFSFFLAIPTMTAAFAHELLDVRHHLGPERAGEIAVGFVMSFIASAAIVKPFVNFVRRSGFAPFAWYRIVVGIVLLAALVAGWTLPPGSVVAP